MVKYDLMINDFDLDDPTLTRSERGETNGLYLSYSQLLINAYARVHHVDFNQFVSSVGGGLGLFLGFSLLNAFIETYAIIQRIGERQMSRSTKVTGHEAFAS